MNCLCLSIDSQLMLFPYKFQQNARQMRGEELEGLRIEELQRLEKSLEARLGFVIQKKRYVSMSLIESSA